MVATRCRHNRKFCSLPLTVKAEARFRVKTKIRPEVTISEQFQPTLMMWKNTFFHDCGIWGVGEARLPVCDVLVLTHNFEVWRPVVARLLVFWDWGLGLQSGQWQNCKSKLRSRSLITGLKSVVNIYRSYGTYFTIPDLILIHLQLILWKLIFVLS